MLRLDQRWQWYSRDGNWNYESATQTRRVAAGTVDAAADKPALIETRLDWGRYRLEVSASDGSGLISSTIFNAGYYADEGADSPETLDVALDKPAYQVGETARVKVTSRSGGRALVAVLNSGLAATQEVDLPAGGGEVPVRVASDWGAGAYVTVMLYRPMDEKAKRMPSRALGLRWLAVDQTPQTIQVGLQLPEKVKSASVLKVPVKLTGIAAGEEARVTLAAVDVGVLNLTRFEAPKPEGWFFGQRRLGVELRDLYGRLIDGMRAERGRLRSGGDAGGVSMDGNPPVEATLALFSGIVKVGADGTANVEFQLPDFNGTVRVSAVAWSGDKVGSASKDVIVRDAVALTVSGPRFLTLGDQARLELAVHNVEGPAGAYQVSGQYELEPGATKPTRGFERSLTIGAGERKREAFELKPDEVGLTTLAVRVTGPDGIDVRRKLTFDVKVPAGDIKRLSVSSLQAKGGSLSLSSDLLQDLIPRRSKVMVTVGPTAAMDVPGILAALDRYPHGCAEQTTSRALPLLYVNDVAKRLGIASDTQIRARVEAAIERVFEMQDASGAFGIWGPSDGDMWLTSYVTDFLTQGQGAELSGAPVVLQPGAGPAAELHQLRAGLLQRRRVARLRPVRAGPQRPGTDRRAALLRRHQARRLHDAAGAGPAGCGAGHDGRQGARRGGSQGGAQVGAAQGRRVIPPRLRHRHPRRRGADYAGGRDRHRQAGGAAHDRRGEQGVRRAHLHLDAGAGLDAAGGAGTRRGGQEHHADGERPAAAGAADAVPVGGGPAGRRHQDRQHGRRPGRCRGVGGRRSADAGAAGLQGLHHRARLLHDGWQAGGPEERDRRHRARSSRTSASWWW